MAAESGSYRELSRVLFCSLKCPPGIECSPKRGRSTTAPAAGRGSHSLSPYQTQPTLLPPAGLLVDHRSEYARPQLLQVYLDRWEIGVSRKGCQGHFENRPKGGGKSDQFVAGKTGFPGDASRR